MVYQNYTLEIVSHHPEFKNRNLKKYYVDGIETVGAYGNEPFEIRFKNNSWQKVQVKLSVDGTDILSGETATTEVGKEMWVVNGYGTLAIKAWPETHNGGAGFVFTNSTNSVAVHTHGDLSSRGIIAAAVYVEGHVEPQKTINYLYPYWQDNYFGSITCGGGFSGSIGSNGTLGSSGFTIPTVDSVSYNCSVDSTDYTTKTRGDLKLESLVAVGAGDHVDQKITYVAGLVEPKFSETIRVRYVWYDDLVNKLKENNHAMPHASGFPGDKIKGINLGTTPKIKTQQRVTPAPIHASYARV